MSEKNYLSKTEMQWNWWKWIEKLWIPFFSIRKSDLYHDFLPAFYFFILIIIILYINKYWFSSNDFSITDKMDYIKKYKYETLLFIVPLLFILLKLIWLIISQISRITLLTFKCYPDQSISKEIFEHVWYKNIIIKWLNNFYKWYIITENDLTKATIYWCIFNYVMDYYYGQENIYDDLRISIFLRNLIWANVLLGIIIISTFNCELIIYSIIILLLFSKFYYKMYLRKIRYYHSKLVRTFLYINSNLEYINSKKDTQ